MEQCQCSVWSFSFNSLFPRTTLGVPITKIVDSEVLDMMSDNEDAKNKADEGDVKEADPADVEE